MKAGRADREAAGTPERQGRHWPGISMRMAAWESPGYQDFREASVFDSEPFGQRAVRLGFATSEQVREALETQQLLSEKAGLLGEILVEMGWLDADRYIELVQALMDEEVEGDREQVQEAFVSRALAGKHVSADNIENARRIQAGWNRKGKLIGQVMVEMGFLRPAQLEEILATYRRNR